MERKVMLHVATSLDGFVARRDGSVDWLPAFRAGEEGDEPLAHVDTVLLGRRTYEAARERHGVAPFGTRECIVFSRRRAGTRDRHARYTGDEPADVIRRLRERRGQGIWLVGGGEIVRECLDAGVVNQVTLSIVPVLLGDGVPLFLPRAGTTWLQLQGSATLPDGRVQLTYAMARRSPSRDTSEPTSADGAPAMSAVRRASASTRVAAAAVGAEMVRAWSLRESPA